MLKLQVTIQYIWLSFIELSLYDAFATMHFYTIRDQEINNCDQCLLISQFCNSESPCPIIDFAHERPAFLTWHRAFMLYLETEMQGCLMILHLPSHTGIGLMK